MRIKPKATALAAAAGALAIAVPAAAHPGNTNHPSGKNNSEAHTHRCTPHKVAYIVSGSITASTMTPNPDGTWSGTLTYTVTHHNHWAKSDPGNATLSDVKVTFDNGATDFSTLNQVKLIGKVEVVRSKGNNACSNPGAQAGSLTIRKVVVSLPAA
jgi:hypothetical protein